MNKGIAQGQGMLDNAFKTRHDSALRQEHKCSGGLSPVREKPTVFLEQSPLDRDQIKQWIIFIPDH